MPHALTATRDESAGARRTTHRLYGRTLTSAFDFANRLAPGAGSGELTFDCVRSAPFPGALEEVVPAYASPARPGDGKSDILVYHLESCWVVRFRDTDFHLFDDRIVCHLPDPELQYLAEIQLLGVVFSCWLERRGIPALHASAISVEDRAAAFLSTAGGGKSSLGMTFMQEGYPLLTDDILAVERTGESHLAHPGYPQVRMWPDQAERFLGRYDDLEIVHPAFSKRRVPVGKGGFGSFCEASRTLACLYLPERRDSDERGTEIEISAVPRREGLMRLIGNSFVAPIVQTLGLEPRRMELLGPLLSQVPVRRLSYPDGMEHLPRVRRAVVADLAVLANDRRSE